MIRINAKALSGALALLFVSLYGTAGVEAKAAAKKPETSKADKKSSKGAAKPALLENYGDWGAFLAQTGKDKTCYALASPKERMPAGLQRDPAYVFISNRPAENVRNEISIIMGFPMKDGSSARAEIGNTGFELVAKGPNAWVKNPAEEAQFIDVMKKNAKLVVKASSIKGNATTDSYSLKGFSQALERALKECS
jgi:invasion protein IalB